MDQLPAELINHILEYISPRDLVTTQLVCRRFLKLSRDNNLWRSHCYDQSPSASIRPWAQRGSATLRSSSGASLTPVGQAALDNLLLHHVRPRRVNGDAGAAEENNNGASETAANNAPASRQNAIADWDPSHETEKIDWYSEYVARHGPVSMRWFTQPPSGSSDHSPPPEVRGMGLLRDTTGSGHDRVVGPLDDGRIGIWKLNPGSDDTVYQEKTAHFVASEPGILFENHRNGGECSSTMTRSPEFNDAECVSIDSVRGRAYIAVSDILNEVDLGTLKVVSQSKFAWPISALSQGSAFDCPVTIGTSFSLHLHDPRQRSDIGGGIVSSDLASMAEISDTIAFLPNYSKLGLPNGSPPPLRKLCVSRPHSQVGPLSILHQNPNSIVLAGRFPSLLFYDRRRFPQLETTLHSGARLSGLASIDFPPKGFDATSAGEPVQTLVACGEYNGRGSLELYSVPPAKRVLQSSEGAVEEYSGSPGNFVYQNRQTASRSKLLSVATHGGRIVFSDTEGGLKWVERDGHSLVRRWNINSYSLNVADHSLLDSRQIEGGVQGHDVVRKMIPVVQPPADRGVQGHDDLLVWTGEKIGVVRFKPRSVDEMEASFESDEEGSKRVQEEEYNKQMRRALERQADEFKWMRRFGTRYGTRW